MTVDDIAPFGAALENRILLIADEGCVARLLGDGLVNAGCGVTRASPRDEDLFSKAVDHDTIVYLPARSLLDASSCREGPVDSEVKELLGAANAPGVKLLVTVIPAATEAQVLEEAIQRSGVPYFLVRSPALIEELKVELSGEVPETIWVPECEGVAFGDAEALVRTVRQCLVDDRQGNTVELPAAVTDIPSALRRALSADERRVIAVWPPLFQMGRVVARMMRGRDTPDLRLIDALLARRDESLTPPRRAA
ncbi:MAG TPA: hypothetical protein VHE30_29115 [Polyangiaceae bacterium]|nr:hypothetical protein [Polyangiaceae bacterium]